MQICVYSACKRLIFIFFSLEELHLSLNNFTNIAADDLPTCPSIHRLYLNENAITDWSHVNKLGKVFPNMKHLVLIGNPLETIEYDESLANIEMLNLSGTKLKDWSEIEKLRKFPCLKAVRLRKIPFLEVNKNIIPYNLAVPCVSMTVCAWLWLSISWFYPYPSGLLHWQWGNHMIVPMPVKQPLRMLRSLFLSLFYNSDFFKDFWDKIISLKIAEEISRDVISMALVTLLLMHWSYCSPMLTIKDL